MAEINYEILGRKVADLYPNIAKELVKTPNLSDVSLLTEIYHQNFSERTNAKAKLIFIGVILHLYDPDVLSGWKRNLCRGIRSQLAMLFNVSDTAISNNIQTVRNYYMIYKKFKTEVDYISEQISKKYQEQ